LDDTGGLIVTARDIERSLRGRDEDSNSLG
jgi:hypothetical protein